MEVIAQQSRQLQGLSLILPSQWCLVNDEGLGATFRNSFHILGILTELGINWNSPEGMATFFSHVGISCPQLKLLILGDQVNFGRKERLALVLWKHFELLPNYPMKNTTEDHEQNILFPVCRRERHCRHSSLPLSGKFDRRRRITRKTSPQLHRG